MISNKVHELAARLAGLTILLVSLGFLQSCSQNRVAGGYDDVENPALTLSLQDAQGQPNGLGEVKVYARFHNPMMDTVPLLTRITASNGTVTIKDSVLISAMKLARNHGIPWPTTDSIEFNIVAQTSTLESYSGEFILARTGSIYTDSIYRFRQRRNGILYGANKQGELSVNIAMQTAISGYRGNIGSLGKQLLLQSVFIPGSPYGSTVSSDGAFTIARMAAGRYDLKAMDGSGKVYSADLKLDTDSAYTGSNWSESNLIWIPR